ncbi:hypothetical protein MRX96_026296 [Rhipicephalus microplus]
MPRTSKRIAEALEVSRQRIESHSVRHMENRAAASGHRNWLPRLHAPRDGSDAFRKQPWSQSGNAIPDQTFGHARAPETEGLRLPERGLHERYTL